MPRPRLFTHALAAILLSASLLLASDSDSTPVERLTRAIDHWKQRKSLHFSGHVAPGQAAGATITMGGGHLQAPFDGNIEIHRGNNETLVVSEALLPGFAFIDLDGRQARNLSYSDRAPAIDGWVVDLVRLVDSDLLLLAVAQGREWQQHPGDSGTLITGQLDPSVLPQPTPSAMGLPAAKVVELTAEFTLDSEDRIASIQFSIGRTDPMRAMIQFGGRQGNDSKAASRQTITLQPSEGLSKRAQRERLEHLAGLSKTSKAAPRPSSPRPPVAIPGLPRGRTPVAVGNPEAAIRSRLQAVISKYDGDEDGQLSKSEAGERWERLSKYDDNEDEHISLQELLAGYQARKSDEAKLEKKEKSPKLGG